MAMKPMTDAEIKDLARALLKNEVVMSDSLTDREIPLVFLALNFLDAKTAKQMKKDGVTQVWEYMRESRHSRMSINGLPNFFSFHQITKDDHAKVRAEWRRLKAAIGEPVPEPKEDA